MAIREKFDGFNRPDWNDIPASDGVLLEKTFEKAAACIEERCGFRYRMDRADSDFVIAPDNTREAQFKISRTDQEYVLGESHMTMRDRPIYVGALDDTFAAHLQQTLVERLPADARVVFQSAIPGMPRENDVCLESLKAMMGYHQKLSPQRAAHKEAVALPRAKTDGVVTLRNKNSTAAKPDWL